MWTDVKKGVRWVLGTGPRRISMDPVFEAERLRREKWARILILLGLIFVVGAVYATPHLWRQLQNWRADRIGADICGQPMALASALAKISRAAGQVVNIPAERNPASASLFIINPLHALRMDRLFATHPAVEERIARLQAMAGSRQGPWGGK